jgi:hypothetical protein
VPATSAVASGVLVLVCLRVWLMSIKSMHTYAHVCARMLTYAHVCSRMLS